VAFFKLVSQNSVEGLNKVTNKPMCIAILLPGCETRNIMKDGKEDRKKFKGIKAEGWG